MKLTIEIKMDNAAFTDWNAGEASRILAKCAENISYYNVLVDGDKWNLLDFNGNTVGKVEVTK